MPIKSQINGPVYNIFFLYNNVQKYENSLDYWFVISLYWCVLYVFVTEGDPYFTTKLSDYTAVEKDEVVLHCEVSKSKAPVKWFKDGQEIIPSKNVVITTDGKKRILTIKKASKKDIGEYACDCGTDKTIANLNIEGNTYDPWGIFQVLLLVETKF